ncbi:MAG: PorV/PorQ family protein [Ignavibacteriales bacterium]|nr:PorV/PorQ family protein [Ignavibacteriales bacterium]
MKTKTSYLLMILCVAAAVVVSSSVAQNKRVGTSAASELLIPVGARDLSMGGAGLASSMGVNAIYWNPAGMARMGKSSAEAMFSSMSYIADIGVSYGAVAAQFADFGTVGLSVKSLDFGDIPLTTEDDPENASGRFYSPTFVTFGFSYARSLTDAISVGGTLKIISEQIERVSSSGFAVDFGVQYNGLVGVQGLLLGVTVKNIGPQMKYDGSGLFRLAVTTEGTRPEQRYKSETASFELPSVVEVGLAYDATVGENMNLMLNGAFTNNNLYLDEYKFGGEISMGMESVRLFGRVGGTMLPDADSDLKENIFGITYGFGLDYAAPGIGITIDYAYRSVELFDANNVFTVKFGF